MSRYIDADALFAEFENVDWYNNADRDEIAERLVLQAPTIDAVSVVRCKDCKYGEYRADYDDYECNASGCGLVYDAEYFCAEGEREGE